MWERMKSELKVSDQKNLHQLLVCLESRLEKMSCYYEATDPCYCCYCCCAYFFVYYLPVALLFQKAACLKESSVTAGALATVEPPRQSADLQSVWPAPCAGGLPGEAPPPLTP